MRRGAAVAAVVLVVLEVATAVLVNLVTGGGRLWLWLVLATLVVCTCAVVWWQEGRHDQQGSTEVSLRARRWGVIRRSPVRVRARGDISARVEASTGGQIEDSEITIGEPPPEKPGSG